MCDHTPLAPATDKTLAPRAVVQSAWRAHPGGTQDARGDGKAAWGLEFVLLFYLLCLDFLHQFNNEHDTLSVVARVYSTYPDTFRCKGGERKSSVDHRPRDTGPTNQPEHSTQAGPQCSNLLTLKQHHTHLL